MKITLYMPDSDKAKLRAVKRVVRKNGKSLSELFRCFLDRYAKTHLIAFNSTAAGKAANRRVQVVLGE